MIYKGGLMRAAVLSLPFCFQLRFVYTVVHLWIYMGCTATMKLALIVCFAWPVKVSDCSPAHQDSGRLCMHMHTVRGKLFRSLTHPCSAGGRNT